MGPALPCPASPELAPRRPGRTPRGRLAALARYTLPWAAMGWLATSQLYFFWRGRGAPGLRQSFLWQAPPWLAWALATPLIVHLTRRVGLGAPGRRARALSCHAALALATTASYCAAAVLCGRLSGPMAGSSPFLIEVLLMIGRMADTQIIIYVGVVALQHALWQQQKGERAALSAARLAQQLAQAQLQSLRRQLQPHFLFNTLHTVGLLVRKGDRGGALRVLADLGDLLRALLEDDEDGRHLVTLREELGLLDRYLAIERVRFQDRLRVELRIEPAALRVRVPNLLLQPLVENALRHGLAPRDEPGRLLVRAALQEGRLLLQIEDDGVGLPPPARRREGTGLRNTRERLRHLYPRDHRLVVVALPVGVRVEVDLPAQEGRAHA